MRSNVRAWRRLWTGSLAIGLFGLLASSQTPARPAQTMAEISAERASAKPPPTLDESLGIEAVAGALVVKVDPDSPASRAGLSLGDVVVALGQSGLRSYADHEAFRYAIHDAAMFTGASLQVWKFDPAVDSYRPGVIDLRTPAGVNSRDGFATILRVMVISVPDDSLAAADGRMLCDVIEEINAESVETVRHLVDLDSRLQEALARNGRVDLTVARWRPAPDSTTEDLSLDTRQLTVMAGTGPKSPR